MRPALRLFAAVKPGRFLEPYAPTGLCGLYTHPTPRSTLLYLYNSTLEKLQQFPESSVYRQSTEALTRHRLKIVESTQPKGLRDWQEKIQMQVADNPDAFKIIHSADGKSFTVQHPPAKRNDEREEEYDGEKQLPAEQEGPYNVGKSNQDKKLAGDKPFNTENVRKPSLDPEPPLTADQISDIESQIGAGLIEEVIQVAEGEHHLVDKMLEAKVWEDLAEKAPEGQWSYFERGTHTATQKP